MLDNTNITDNINNSNESHDELAELLNLTLELLLVCHLRAEECLLLARHLAHAALRLLDRCQEFGALVVESTLGLREFGSALGQQCALGLHIAACCHHLLYLLLTIVGCYS